MDRGSPIQSPFKTAAALTAVLVVAIILSLAKAVLVPLALAILLTFLLAPFVRRLERLRLPRVLSVLLIVGFSTFLLGGLGWLVEEEVVELAANLPEYKSNLAKKLGELHPPGGSVLGRAGQALSELGHKIAGDASISAPPPVEGTQPLPVKVIDAPTPPIEYAKNLIGTILGPLSTAGIVVVFSIFMLIKREDVRNRFIRLVGQRSMHVTTPALDDAAGRISRYLLMQSVTNGAAGLAIGVGLYVIGVPGALVWGLLIALMRFLPYVGTWAAAALPVAISLASSSDWTDPLLTIALIVAIELVISNAVEPLVFGSHTGVSPLAILAAAVFWAWLWGPIGLLLATPMTVCLAVIGKHVPALEFLDVLLGDEPVLAPETQLYQRLLAGDSEEAGDIVEAFAKGKPLSEVYENLVLPAIRLGEMVRHRGEVDEVRDRSIREMFGVMIEDLGDRIVPRPAPDATPTTPKGIVMCLPARDNADQLVGRMVARLLSGEGVQAEALSAETLTGEVMDQVAARAPAAVCVSAVPPGAAVYTRVLCKRLRARFPDLPIVVGVWDASVNVQAALDRLNTTGPVHVFTGVQQAVDQLKSLAECSPSMTLQPKNDATTA